VTVLDFARALGVLKTHWRWPLMLTCLLAGLVALGYTLLAPSYRATTTVILDNRGVERLLDTQRDANPTATAMVSTDLDVIRSEAVLRRVISTLALDATDGRLAALPRQADQAVAKGLAAERQDAWQQETKGKLPLDLWLLRWLGKALLVQRAAADSNVVAISIDHPGADAATLLANTIGQSYLAVALELSLAPTQQAAAFFETQIGQTRATLSRAQTARSRFQRDNGLVSVSEGADLENTLMTEMATAATQARAHGAEATARSGTATANPGSSPEVMQAAVVQQLSTDLERHRAVLTELSGRLGSMHPQVQAQQQQVSQLQQRLQAEVARVTESVEMAARSANGSDRAVQAMLLKQRDRVMALKQAREQLGVLQQDVDVAQRAYDQALQRHALATARNDSLLSSARVLAPASTPLSPTRPPLLLALIFTVFSGLLLGTGGAFLAEQRRPLVRLEADVIDLLGVPILAATPRVALTASRRKPWALFAKRRLPGAFA